MQRSFWIKRQRVHGSGEVKYISTKPQGNQNARMRFRTQRGEVLIAPGVTAVRPEAERAILGQTETGIPARGGSKGYCVHAFPRAENRSEMLIVLGNSWFLPNLAVVKPFRR